MSTQAQVKAHPPDPEPTETTASGIVEATERLYRTLFAAALGFACAAAAWGLVIAPFNSFERHRSASVVLGFVLLLASVSLALSHRWAYPLLRECPVGLIGVALVGVAVLWTDGGWRSSYYLASYSALGLSAVVARRRWSFLCAGVLAIGYVAGLTVNGYTWHELRQLHDADSVVANTGGYFIAAGFFSYPIAWLGRYVARINQVIVAAASQENKRLRTGRLSVRETQVAQLVADGLSNEQIGARLSVSARTAQTHVRSCLRKTGVTTRTELAVLAVREGLVPMRPMRFDAANRAAEAPLRHSADTSSAPES